MECEQINAVIKNIFVSINILDFRVQQCVVCKESGEGEKGGVSNTWRKSWSEKLGLPGVWRGVNEIWCKMRGSRE